MSIIRKLPIMFHILRPVLTVVWAGWTTRGSKPSEEQKGPNDLTVKHQPSSLVCSSWPWFEKSRRHTCWTQPLCCVLQLISSPETKRKERRLRKVAKCAEHYYWFGPKERHIREAFKLPRRSVNCSESSYKAVATDTRTHTHTVSHKLDPCWTQRTDTHSQLRSKHESSRIMVTVRTSTCCVLILSIHQHKHSRRGANTVMLMWHCTS